MDEKDRQILEILKEDGRASYTRIAEEIGVSEGTVRNRVEKLQEDGVIEKFTVETSGTGARSMVMVELETGEDIEEIVSGLPGDVEILEVTGSYDLILNVERSSNEEINEAIDEIRLLKGVKNTKTFIVLKERK